jgi:transcriptional regulator with XRE-family HTH domain
MVDGFAERLRYYMSLRGVTQSQLAEETHLTEAAISRYLSNTREPKAIAVAAIARALNVSADDLLGLAQTSQGSLDDALRLVARNANEITTEQRKQLINALIR